VNFELGGAVVGRVGGEHACAGAQADRAVALAQVPRHVVSATRISRPGSKNASMPSHQSVITGTPQAAASKRRTLGDHPAATMSARVTLSVNRCAA
jgi:hypothetical protein